MHALCTLPQFLLVNMSFNPIEGEGCYVCVWGGMWAFPPFIHGPVIPEGRYLIETSHLAVFQGLSISVYILAVSLSMFSLYLLHEDYPLLG